jgi:MinD-like ATPase involved in chromosome partitioning or flagellar assembly
MTKVISCVSFKGGAGRSVSLANLAFQFAQKGHRVGCVDFDIEGGGLHKIFRVEDNVFDSIQQCLMDEEDYKSYSMGKEPPDYANPTVFRARLIVPVKDQTADDWASTSPPSGEIFLIQAKPDAEATGLVDTGMNLFYRFHQLLGSFGKVENLDYVFVDCRSGISNLGLPGLAYSDATLVFLRWAPQHCYGTEHLVKWYTSWLSAGGMQTHLVIVACAVFPGDIDKPGLQTYCDHCFGTTPHEVYILPYVERLRSSDALLWRPEDAEPAARYRELGGVVRRLLHGRED